MDLFAEFDGTPVTVSYIPRARATPRSNWIDAPQFGSLRTAIAAVRDDADRHMCLVVIHDPQGDRELTYDQVASLVRKLSAQAA
jgi:hypothetical protein